MSYGYVYLVTNLINGKTYVGQRRAHRDSDWNEYFGSGKLIKAALESHGKENFRKDLLAHAETQEELDEIESSFIVAEWEAMRGEYNLRSFVPSPNAWTNLPSGKLVEKMDKWRTAEKLNRSSKDPALNPSHLRAEARWESFLERVSLLDLKALYEEKLSLEKAAREINESPKHLHRWLKANDVPMPKRAGNKSARSLEERGAIQAGVRLKLGLAPCALCHPGSTGSLCKKHQKATVAEKEAVKSNAALKRDASVNEILSSFAVNGSMRQTSAALGISRREVRKVLVDSGIEIPPQSTNAARVARKNKSSIR